LQFFSDKVKIKHKMTPRMNMRDLYWQWTWVYSRLQRV
jgi:hypothetical protein